MDFDQPFKNSTELTKDSSALHRINEFSKDENRKIPFINPLSTPFLNGRAYNPCCELKVLSKQKSDSNPAWPFKNFECIDQLSSYYSNFGTTTPTQKSNTLLRFTITRNSTIQQNHYVSSFPTSTSINKIQPCSIDSPQIHNRKGFIYFENLPPGLMELPFYNPLVKRETIFKKSQPKKTAVKPTKELTQAKERPHSSLVSVLITRTSDQPSDKLYQLWLSQQSSSLVKPSKSSRQKHKLSLQEETCVINKRIVKPNLNYPFIFKIGGGIAPSSLFAESLNKQYFKPHRSKILQVYINSMIALRGSEEISVVHLQKEKKPINRQKTSLVELHVGFKQKPKSFKIQAPFIIIENNLG